MKNFFEKNFSKWQPRSTVHTEARLSPDQKARVEGSGPFVDPSGSSRLTGNSIVRPWRSGASLFILFFTVCWNTIVFSEPLWKDPLWGRGLSLDSLPDVLSRLPFLLFPLIGLGLAYISICWLVNRTTVSIRNGTLNVTRGPLPWPPRSISIPTWSIKQLYVEQYCSHRENRQPVIKYQVKAQLSNQGSDVCVEKGMAQYNSARILEQWIEDKLRIDDAPVLGEVRV